jgi:D-3-phosphoglycerate dehydrogenase / 2-oxoglutarate reductase
MMKIVALDDWSHGFKTLPCYARLMSNGDHEVTVYHDTEKNLDKLAARINGAEALILTQERTLFPRELIQRLTTVKLVAQTGSHRHHIDFAACTEKGILVAAPSRVGVGVSTAELTWALILASLRHIPHEVEQLKLGAWQTTMGTGLRGLTLGIYGLGGIGSLVAQVGKVFGMQVMGWGREASREKIRAAGYDMPATRQEFFARCDVLSLHIFANEATRGIITAADLAVMKPTSLLVNTSRARLIADGALVVALKHGRPGRAAVDVYEEEPVLHGDHPLLKMPNVICTPHLGYAVTNTFEHLYGAAIDSILGFAAGKPVNILNPEALQAK